MGVTRPLLTALGMAMAVLCGAQPTGTYRPAGSPPASWTINEHHALMWNGQPYLPVGVRVSKASEISAIAEKGVRDVVVELPAAGSGWHETIEALEAKSMRYLISIDSLAPECRGVAVEPEGYRVAGILADTVVQFDIAGCESALAVLATKRDGMIQSSERVKVVDGTFKLAIKAPNSLEHILLVYPETSGLSLPDYWEGFDSSRDQLLASLKKSKLGPGLRGIINPMGELLRLQDSSTRFVPTGAYFRNELKAFLSQRYRSVDTVVKSWSISASDIESWDHLARLVPLWSESRGVPRLWDTKTDRLYTVDQRRSTIWADIDSVVSAAAARRFARLIPSIRKVADVPVLQDWAGWAAPYEQANPALDGVGMRTIGGTSSTLAASGSRAASSLLRWRKSGWLCATDCLIAANDPLSEVLNDLTSMGARGWFFRTSDPALLDAISKIQADAVTANWSPRPIFFPESAMNPAMPQQLPNGHWWLPSPASGNRIDLGRSFFAYRYSGLPEPFTAIWTSGGMGRVKLRFADPKPVGVMAIDGTDLKPKLHKNGVEITLSETPVLIKGTDEIPIPEPSLNEMLGDLQVAIASAEGQLRDITEEAYLFREAANGFDRNPGGSFSIMRIQYNRILRKLAPYDWIEAESSREHTFSESTSVVGCSGNSALALRTQIAPMLGGYFARYKVNVRSKGEQEVWIAAKIPASERANVRLSIDGQPLVLESEPVAAYGSGFAWYRAGVAQFLGNQATVEVQVASGDAANLMLDVILLHPGRFEPRGIFQPPLTPKG